MLALLDLTPLAKDVEAWSDIQALCAASSLSKGKSLAKLNSLLKDNANDTLEERTVIGNTPLHLACLQGASALVEALISEGADVATRNKYAETPLHHAVQTRCKPAIRSLLAAHADVNALDDDRQTPLHWAMDRADEGCEVVELLLDAGADIQAPDFNRHTPLHLAAAEGSTDAVMMLLERGGSLHQENVVGCSVFMCAVARDQVHVVRELLMLDPRLRLSFVGRTGSSVLHVAAMENSTDVLEMFLADATQEEIVAEDRRGFSPLMVAKSVRNTDVYRMLKERESQITDAHEATDAHVAVKMPQQEYGRPSSTTRNLWEVLKKASPLFRSLSQRLATKSS